MLGSWLSGRFARHWRGSTLGIVGHLVMASGILLFILPSHWWGLALTFVPAGIGMSLGGLAISVAISNRSHAEQQGQAIGLYRGLTVSSSILAAVVGSLVLLAGTEWPFYLATLCSLASAAGFYLLAPPCRPSSTAGQLHLSHEGITVRCFGRGQDLHRGAGSGTVKLFTDLFDAGGAMSEYKAIALDMDGTLLTRDHKISSATRAALAQARAHGIKVLLVTGRHYMTARPFHHELALDTPPHLQQWRLSL